MDITFNRLQKPTSGLTLNTTSLRDFRSNLRERAIPFVAYNLCNTWDQRCLVLAAVHSLSSPNVSSINAIRLGTDMLQVNAPPRPGHLSLHSTRVQSLTSDLRAITQTYLTTINPHQLPGGKRSDQLSVGVCLILHHEPLLMSFIFIRFTVSAGRKAVLVSHGVSLRKINRTGISEM